mgnify:CR=1 FL=1
MGTFLVKRLLHMIPILLGVSLLTFLLMSLTPGGYLQSLKQNPQISPETVERLLAKFHLDKPWYVQYLYWLKNVATGDFGYSIQYKISATDLITARLWNTFVLSFFATVVASHEKGLTVHDQLRTIARQCNAWTLPYGVSLAEKEDVRDGAVASDALRQRLAMLTRDVRVYGELLATQRRNDLAGTEPGFLARLRK